MIGKLCVLYTLFAAAGVAAADSVPTPGSFGFNWLETSSRCKQLTAKDLATFSTCTVSSNAFGLPLNSLVCKVNSHIEYMVYKTAAQCQEALETMQSNGP